MFYQFFLADKVTINIGTASRLCPIISLCITLYFNAKEIITCIFL